MKIGFTLLALVIMIAPVFIYMAIPERDMAFENDISIVRNVNKRNVDNYKVEQTFSVIIDQEEIFVPKGYETNLQSIPSIIRKNYTPALSAYMLHSFLYDCPEFYTRYEVDVALYHALLISGESHWNAFKSYLAVRLLSRPYFYKDMLCYDKFD